MFCTYPQTPCCCARQVVTRWSEVAFRWYEKNMKTLTNILADVNAVRLLKSGSGDRPPYG